MQVYSTMGFLMGSMGGGLHLYDISSKKRRQNSIFVAPGFHIVSLKAIIYFVTSAEGSQNCLGCL